MAIIADRDLDLIDQIYREVGATVTHKAHGDECNCAERASAALSAIAALALGSTHLSSFGQMPPQLIGKTIRVALLPQSLGMFLKEHPEVNINPLPALAYIEDLDRGWVK